MCLQDKEELATFTRVAHSREFGDTGWVVGWSKEPKILKHFNLVAGDTPKVLLYRDFDALGTILDGGERDVVECV